jgi:hypothetical protein
MRRRLRVVLERDRATRALGPPDGGHEKRAGENRALSGQTALQRITNFAAQFMHLPSLVGFKRCVLLYGFESQSR